MKLNSFSKKAEKLRDSTLCFLVKEDQVLLAMKKRGFGKDRWNGVGGKLNLGETIKQAAVRETKEEIEVIVRRIEKVAVLDFYFPNDLEWNQRVSVFMAKKWNGEPLETEEMAPKWFIINKLPFESMWPDDIYWLPQVLNGKKIKAEFLFGGNDTLLDYKVSQVKNLAKYIP